MTCKYTLIGDNLTENTTEGYGIAAVSADKIIAEIHGISKDREKVENLVNTCNRLELSTVHFYDVVEDFIG